jgi:hypothetical protein
MKRKKLTLLVLAPLLFTYPIFAWQIIPHQENKNSFTEQKNQVVFNLVFTPLNYEEGEFQKDLFSIIEKLKKTKPFDEFNQLGLWYITLSKKEQELIIKPSQDFPPLKVRKDFLEDISTQLKSIYKLIIIDAAGSVSCAELSSPDKLSLIILGRNRYKDSQSFAKGFLHELGHSLGLRDECVKCAQLSPAGPPNCASTQEEAEKWWGDLVGKDYRVNYINGCCGNRNYIRPTIASFMNDPDKAEDFGPVNERYLRRALRN